METRYLIFIGLFVAFIPALLARRNGDGIGRKGKHSGCADWTYGPCALKNKTATCGIGKKSAIATDENCPLKQKQVHCIIPCEGQSTDCKYKKPRNIRSRDISCDPVTNQYEITFKLVKGDPSSCAPTKVISKECRKRQVRAAAAKENRRAGERKQKKATATTTAVGTMTSATSAPKTASECKYRKAKGPKASCDTVTSTREVVRQLKKNSPATCEPTKTFTESCHAMKTRKEGRKNSERKNA